ncbi:hypothetical protein Q3G72_027589 [Acer saccharum]|nr:hypothetical protein Q3G72_027589 [Acer saccharum]
MLGSVNSATKSATACALIAVRGRYSTSNSLNSIAHFVNRPDTSDFCRINFSGQLYIGFWIPSSCRTSTELVAASETDKYMYNVSPVSGFDSSGACPR